MFHFRFQTLYDHQKRLEEKLQIDFSNIQRKFEQESLILEQYQDVQSRNVKELQSEIRKGMQVEKIVLYKNFIHKTTHMINQQAKKLSQLEDDVEKAKKAVISAMKKRKAFEKLKAKAWMSFKNEMQTMEKKLLDETSIRKYIMSSSGSDENVP